MNFRTTTNFIGSKVKAAVRRRRRRRRETLMAVSPKSLLFLSLLLLSSTVSQSFFSNYHALFSLSHSQISRVAALRAARGDVEGAERARALARNLERGLGLGFYKYAWSMGWDYVKNYAWSDAASFRELGGVVTDLNSLLGFLSDGRNYREALRVSQSLIARLLKVFSRSVCLMLIFIS